MTEIEKAHIMWRRLADMINVIGTSDRAQIAHAMHAMIGKAEKLEAAEAEFAAFKQEVSDAVEGLNTTIATNGYSMVKQKMWERLNSFVIAKPDPLVDVLYDFGDKVTAAELRQALAARGLKIVEQD